jgi:hypothetical protein
VDTSAAADAQSVSRLHHAFGNIGGDNGAEVLTYHITDTRTGKDKVVEVMERKLDVAGNTEIAIGTDSSSCTQDSGLLGEESGLHCKQRSSCQCGNSTDTVTFSADFKIVLTAQTRYDIGIWFSTDGDPANNGPFSSDGALMGQCTVATLATGPEPKYANLDDAKPGDICGDH